MWEAVRAPSVRYWQHRADTPYVVVRRGAPVNGPMEGFILFARRRSRHLLGEGLAAVLLLVGLSVAAALTPAAPVAAAGDHAALAASTSRTPTGSPTPTVTPTPSATPAETLPRPTHSRRLRIYFGGDSVAWDVGSPFARMAAATGVMTCRVDAVVSSRIVTDFQTNWPARMRQVMRSTHPKAVVFMIGTNEGGWSLTVNGRYLDFWSDAWRDYYRHRVRKMLDIMFKGGARRVYWVGMPKMGPNAHSGMNEQMMRINNCVKKEIAARPAARFIDSWSILCTKSGAYVDAWRAGDDMHLSPSGGKRLAPYVMKAVKKDWLPRQ